MEINFCEGCDNIMFIYSDQEQEKLYLGCKKCGTKKDYLNNNCIYKNEFKFDFSETINNNKYINHDTTLPIIEDNKNIKCPNEDCSSDKPSNITYIKYDEDKLRYIYICNCCGQKWKNN